MCGRACARASECVCACVCVRACVCVCVWQARIRVYVCASRSVLVSACLSVHACTCLYFQIVKQIVHEAENKNTNPPLYWMTHDDDDFDVRV